MSEDSIRIAEERVDASDNLAKAARKTFRTRLVVATPLRSRHRILTVGDRKQRGDSLAFERTSRRIGRVEDFAARGRETRK